MDRAAPMSSLSRFIEDVRAFVPVAGRAMDVEQLPNGRTSLVFRVLADGQRGDMTVVGPRTRALFKHTTEVTRAVILQFKPGWSAPLLGVAADALTDRIVSLEDLWGRSGGELCRELLATTSLPDVITRLTHALTLRTHHTFEPASAQLARSAVRLFEAGEDRVERVAARLGITARHLRRAFKDSIGIGPKEFARTVRLQRAVRRTSTSHDWARIAADAGYYDQAHLIADFQQLVGLTPGAFLKRASQPTTRHTGNAGAAAWPRATTSASTALTAPTAPTAVSG